ncbi:MAG: N-acetyltransferase DgcN [Kiloniellales bacterium]
MEIEAPYLLFLGDAADQLAAKTAQGVAQWRPERCLGQFRMDGCNADLGLTDMTLEAAAEAGARTLVIGVANRGGVISQAWIDLLEQALDLGLDLAAGLHNRMVDVPRLREAAARNGRRLFDVRHPTQPLEVANGRKRPGKRLLTVGTDCSVGKMYASLALEKEMQARGLKADFRATGQTGILIAGSGISVDAVVADFISGATEWLSPANDDDHWDLIEGQGSLFHASFAGVSMGLLHGAQADALVLCHEPTRSHMRGLPDYPLPDLQLCIDANLAAGRLTNPAVRCVGVAINTARLEQAAAEALLEETERRLGLPTVDPLRTGVGPIVDRLLDGTA